MPLLTNTPHVENSDANELLTLGDVVDTDLGMSSEREPEEVRGPKKKQPTPSNSGSLAAAAAQPARTSELPELELSGAWEPGGSSRASQHSEAGRGHSSICYGD